MGQFTVTGGQMLAMLARLAMLLVVVLIAVAGRVLLAAAVIVGVQWSVITCGRTTRRWCGRCWGFRRCWPATRWPTRSPAAPVSVAVRGVGEVPGDDR